MLGGGVDHASGQLNRSGGRRGTSQLQADCDGINHLPAAVEVAAYVITTEAMTNVARHARASCCTVTLSQNSLLHLEVTDDGIGISPHRRPGVGFVVDARADRGARWCTHHRARQPAWHQGGRHTAAGAELMDPVRVLVADDHPMVRDGLAALLGPRPEVDLLGLVGDGEHAIRLAEQLQPDVVVMDLHMPGVTGIDATARIVRTSPRIAVLVLTMLEDDDSLFAAMRAGARGYLVKGAAQDEILRAILAVAGGEAIFGHARPPGGRADRPPTVTLDEATR